MKSIAVIFLITLIVMVLALNVAHGKPDISIGLILGIGAAIVTMINPEAGIIILIISMLLSPEISTPIQVPKRQVVVRFDDILLIAVFITWLVKAAISKELGLLRKNPLNRPIICYILILLFSTCIGIVRNEINVLRSAFYFLKYIEYFMLYFLVSNNIRSHKQIKRFLWIGLFTCIIVCIIAYTQIPQGFMTTAPFEGKEGGEPATLGGYLLVVGSIVLGLFLCYASSVKDNVLLLSFLGFLSLPFLFSFSRASYTAFVVAHLAFLILTPRRKLFLISVMTVGILVVMIAPPKPVERRVTQTFVGKEYRVGPFTLTLEESAGARIDTWAKLLTEKLPRSPLLGYGVTGAGFIDGQYFLTLGEGGLLGLCAFLWIVFAIMVVAYRLFKKTGNPVVRGLALGYLAGLAGLLTHALTTNTFIIVRIMEPFWFLTAIIVFLAGQEEEEIAQRSQNINRKINTEL